MQEWQYHTWKAVAMRRVAQFVQTHSVRPAFNTWKAALPLERAIAKSKSFTASRCAPCLLHYSCWGFKYLNLLSVYRGVFSNFFWQSEALPSRLEHQYERLVQRITRVLISCLPVFPENTMVAVWLSTEGITCQLTTAHAAGAA